MLVDGCLPVLARRNRVKCTVATRESYRSVLPTSPAGCSTSRNSETCRLPNSQYFRITRHERDPCRDAPEFDVLLFLLHAGKKAWLGCTLYIVVRKERRRKKGGLPCPRSSLSRRCSAQGWSPVNLPAASPSLYFGAARTAGPSTWTHILPLPLGQAEKNRPEKPTATEPLGNDQDRYGRRSWILGHHLVFCAPYLFLLRRDRRDLVLRVLEASQLPECSREETAWNNRARFHDQRLVNAIHQKLHRCGYIYTYL